jgi:hypothetical protein
MCLVFSCKDIPKKDKYFYKILIKLFAIMKRLTIFVSQYNGNEFKKLQKIKIMTTLEFKTIATEKLNTLSTNDLIIAVKELSSNFSSAAEYVFNVCLDILMNRLPENEFIELCDSL